MAKNELKEKNIAELQKMLASSREKLRELRFKITSKQLKDVREVREVKKIIARVLTILREKRDVK